MPSARVREPWKELEPVELLRYVPEMEAVPPTSSLVSMVPPKLMPTLPLEAMAKRGVAEAEPRMANWEVPTPPTERRMKRPS